MTNVNTVTIKGDKMNNFKAMVVRDENKEVTYEIEEIILENLSEGEILVEVEYSTVNYKDMLAFQTDGGVIRDYPMIPGIDFAGTVVSSENDGFKKGEQVLVNSTDLGVTRTGGFAEYARVETQKVTKIPAPLTTKDVMKYGTAGFTAALSIQSLKTHGMAPENDPEILVTGSTGGVGSVAVLLLQKAGYKNIHALVRKDNQIDVAKKLGAATVVEADDIYNSRNTLDNRNYHYVVDTVGGDIAAKTLAQIYENGSMAISGNAGGHQLNATVLPFILRGVNLLGINSVNYPQAEKQVIWEKLADEWNVAGEIVYDEIALEDLEENIEAIKNGEHVGRTIVKVK